MRKPVVFSVVELVYGFYTSTQLLVVSVWSSGKSYDFVSSIMEINTEWCESVMTMCWTPIEQVYDNWRKADIWCRIKRKQSDIRR